MNDGWDIVDLLKGKKVIGCKWVYKVCPFAPNGYPITQGKISKLKRSLYGLKQASQQWNLELTGKLCMPLLHSLILSDVGEWWCLIYLNFARPNISFTTLQLSQFVHKPCTTHIDATLHLVGHLKGCHERGLSFPFSNSFHLTPYCDVDWVSCVDSRRSLTGYRIFLGGALIS
ncbi:UNVERIFIED_CONTAM: hypothetical protein Sangu_1030600 [Sesamum angustifolium]|uniref:Reverse transcriptase Ty1/copia-type domain-containing protein n=1 Tax=Sesamum angustifolium TaxID=2727405 RepID=A0AAW2NXR8_9LAMI